MSSKILAIAAIASVVLLLVGMEHGAEPDLKSFRGVVTYHLVPANVMRVNEIVAEPAPGTSHIGEEGILVELDSDIEVRANWTVVDVRYREYETPKTIRYELFGEAYEITVENHAESVTVDGNISDYIGE